jgi:hypothetical protein
MNYCFNIEMMRLGDSCMILDISIYTCNQNRTPRHYFEHVYDFIILKMSTVTIHYFRGFRTRNVYFTLVYVE